MAAPLVLGAVLTVLMAILVDTGVPAFWLAMKRMVADDLTRLFVTQVERGEAISVGDTQIYADSAVRVDPPEGSGAIERLVLSGVAAIQFEEGEPSREFTARAATVDFYREGEDGYLKLVLGDATILNRGDRALAGQGQGGVVIGGADAVHRCDPDASGGSGYRPRQGGHRLPRLRRKPGV